MSYVRVSHPSHPRALRGYGSLVDDALSASAAQLVLAMKPYLIAGLEEYVASEPMQETIAAAKRQLVTLVVVTGIGTALLTVGLLWATGKR